MRFTILKSARERAAVAARRMDDPFAGGEFAGTTEPSAADLEYLRSALNREPTEEEWELFEEEFDSEMRDLFGVM